MLYWFGFPESLVEESVHGVTWRDNLKGLKALRVSFSGTQGAMWGGMVCLESLHEDALVDAAKQLYCC